MSRIGLRTAQMLPRRVIALAALLTIAGISDLAAQIVGWPPQQTNVCSAFVPLKEDADKTVIALNAANKRNAPREEFCQLFQRLSAATGKMLKFLEQNKVQCSVPNEALQGVRTEHNKTLTMRKQACSQSPSASATPSLSDVLGSPVLPDSSANKPNMGTFNTMTGNPLTR